MAGALLALPFTFLVGRRLRGDFAAIGLLVTAVLLNLLVTDYRPLFNGDAGVALVPAPLQWDFILQSSGYQWGFIAVAIVACAGVYVFLRRITESPYGRTLRAMRDNDKVADSLGKNLLSLRTGDAGARRGHRRAVRRRPGQLHQRLVPGRVELRGDHRAVRRGDHRRRRATTAARMLGRRSWSRSGSRR